MRLANEEICDRIYALPCGTEIESAESNEMAGIASKAKWELISFDELAQTNSTVDCLVLNELPIPSLTRQLSTLRWSNSPSCLILGNATEKQLRLWKDAIKVPNLKYIESVDLLAHQAAADFQFWTGVSPMIEPIRDSLEEYMQW